MRVGCAPDQPKTEACYSGALPKFEPSPNHSIAAVRDRSERPLTGRARGCSAPIFDDDYGRRVTDYFRLPADLPE